MKSQISFIEEKQAAELQRLEIDEDVFGPSTQKEIDNLYETFKSQAKQESNEEEDKFSGSFLNESR